MKNIFIFLTIFLFLSPAQSYIPRARTIIKKMTLNNGRRQYKVVREVTLEAQDKQVKAREVWTIANGDQMKLEVSSLDPTTPWHFAIAYRGSKRTTLNSSQSLKTFKKSPDFFEPLFHDRSSRSLMKRLTQHKFIPSWTKDTPPPIYEKGKTLMTPEPYISIEPVEGSISYSIGAAKSQAGGKAQTHLWVEQDSFLIKKARMASGAEFINSEFQNFTGGLKLPSEQTVSWNNNVAKIKLLTVERASIKKSDWKLTRQKTKPLPSDPLIKEFYSRFR